jgi:hypothetical protein
MPLSDGQFIIAVQLTGRIPPKMAVSFNDDYESSYIFLRPFATYAVTKKILFYDD